MAYTGGVYTKPIKNNAQQLAQFYLQGAMQVAQIKEQVQKSRSEELNQLAEATSEIVATGNADADKLIMSGANILRNFTYEGHELNKANQISRSQATARANNARTQAGQLAQLSKHQQESYQEIQDGIAKGDLSNYSAAIKNRFWFKDSNFVPKSFKTADGETVSRNESFTTFMGQNNNLMVSRTFNYLDQDGDVQTKTTYTPLAAMMEDTRLIKSFDANKFVMDFEKTIGDRISPAFSLAGITANGTARYQSIIDAGGLPEIKNTIENHINSFLKNDDNVVSLLSDVFGAAALGDQGHKGYTDQETLKNEIYGKFSMTGPDGQPIEVPRYFDAQGNSLEYTTTDSGKIIDPFTYNLGEDGYEAITDQQRELAGAYLRDRILRSMDIDYKTFTDRAYRPGSRPTKEYDRTIVKSNPSAGYYNNIAIANAAAGQEAMTDYIGALNSLNSNTAIANSPYDGSINTTLKTILKDAPNAGKLDVENKFLPFTIGGDIGKNLLEETQITDTDNHPMKNIKEFIIHATGDEMDPNISLVFVGDSEVAISDEEYELALKKAGKQGLQQYGITENKTIMSPAMSLGRRIHFQNLYEELWKNEDFRTDMESLGFVNDTATNEIFGEGRYDMALYTYSQVRAAGDLISQTVAKQRAKQISSGQN